MTRRTLPLFCCPSFLSLLSHGYAEEVRLSFRAKRGICFSLACRKQKRIPPAPRSPKDLNWRHVHTLDGGPSANIVRSRSTPRIPEWRGATFQPSAFLPQPHCSQSVTSNHTVQEQQLVTCFLSPRWLPAALLAK